MTDEVLRPQGSPQPEITHRSLLEKYVHYAPSPAIEAIHTRISDSFISQAEAEKSLRLTGLYREEVEALLKSDSIPQFAKKGVTLIRWNDNPRKSQRNNDSLLGGQYFPMTLDGWGTFAHIDLYRIPHFDKYANAIRREQLDILENPYAETAVHEFGHNVHPLSRKKI